MFRQVIKIIKKNINIIIAIIIIIIVYRKINISELYTISSDMKTEWLSTGKLNPADRLNDLIKVYGNPSVIDKSKGGIAIWDKKTLKKQNRCWDRIVIRDEQIPHNKPASHIDFLYTTVDYNVPIKKLLEVLGLSDSIMYDQLKQQITVRCHYEKANISTLVLAMRIADGELTLKKVKADDLYKKYIMSEDEKQLKDNEKEICKKVKLFQKKQDKKLRGKRP